MRLFLALSLVFSSSIYAADTPDESPTDASFDVNRYCEMALSGGAKQLNIDRIKANNYTINVVPYYSLYLTVLNTDKELNDRAIKQLGSPGSGIKITHFGGSAAQKTLKQIIYSLQPSVVEELLQLTQSGRDVEVTRELSRFVQLERKPFFKSLPFWTGLLLGYTIDNALNLNLGPILPLVGGVIFRRTIVSSSLEGLSASAEDSAQFVESQQRLQYLEENMPIILGNDLTYDELKMLVSKVVRRGKVMDDVLNHAVRIGLIQTAKQYLELMSLYEASLSGEFPVFVQELKNVPQDGKSTFEMLNPTADEQKEYNRRIGA